MGSHCIKSRKSKQHQFHLNERLEIVWRDPSANVKWLTEQEAKKDRPPTCRTMGRFLQMTRRYVFLAPSVNSDGSRDNCIIPRGACIERIIRLFDEDEIRNILGAASLRRLLKERNKPDVPDQVR